MNPVEADRAKLAANPDDPRCPMCFGWGFPIIWFGDRETYNPSVKCPDCKGRGKKVVAP